MDHDEGKGSHAVHTGSETSDWRFGVPTPDPDRVAFKEQVKAESELG